MRTVALALTLCAIPGAAFADTCSEAFTRSSSLARDGKLVDARNELRVCAAQGCPETMRPLCTHDIAALEPRMPSVVVRARDPDTLKDVVDVVVHVDGALLQETLDGKARDVDPGLHTFRFERGAGGASEQRILVGEGEKNRLITVEWVGQPVVPSGVARRPLPWSAWLSGGLTVAAAGVCRAATGIDGFVKESDLASCKARGCPHDQVQSTATMFNVADVSGGVTLALAALTTVLILTRPTITRLTTIGWLGRGLLLGGRSLAGSSSSHLHPSFPGTYDPLMPTRRSRWSIAVVLAVTGGVAGCSLAFHPSGSDGPASGDDGGLDVSTQADVSPSTDGPSAADSGATDAPPVIDAEAGAPLPFCAGVDAAFCADFDEGVLQLNWTLPIHNSSAGTLALDTAIAQSKPGSEHATLPMATTPDGGVYDEEFLQKDLPTPWREATVDFDVYIAAHTGNGISIAWFAFVGDENLGASIVRTP